MKGNIMDVSSSTGTASSSTQVEALKKSIDVQEKSVLKVLESANEQSKEVTAQKTGMGNNLNLTA
jgi:soluble cytochrome b562